MDPISGGPTPGAIRAMVRPRHLRQPDYEARYDFSTAFYDCVAVDGGLVLIGPPPLGMVVEFAAPVQVTNLTDVRRVTMRRPVDHVMIGGKSHRLKASVHHRNLFSGRRTLLAISKNNKLDWIRDWARFHAVNHGTDAILIYDNRSDYGPSAIVDALRQVPELAVVIVVDWPFRFGPGSGFEAPPGAQWDSRFCQVGAYEHARQKYLASASSILCVDVDEVVVSSNSIHDIAQEKGVAVFDGFWVSSTIQQYGESDYCRYPFLEFPLQPSPPKWCLAPSALRPESILRLHSVTLERGITKKTRNLLRGSRLWSIPPELASFRHYRSITTNWKYAARSSERDGVTGTMWDERLVEMWMRAQSAVGARHPAMGSP